MSLSKEDYKKIKKDINESHQKQLEALEKLWAMYQEKEKLASK